MAKKRPAINRRVKRQLIAEAGNKCANPGCPNVLTEIHHIREWHVAQVHDPKRMIAICPACHDAVSRGELQITDDKAYEWKRILRGGAQAPGQLYIEPNQVPPRLSLGNFAVQGESGLVVFSLDDHHRLQFRLNALELMIVDAVVADVNGNKLVRVVDNHFQAEPESAVVREQRSGFFRMSHPLDPAVVPKWVIDQVRFHEPNYCTSGSVTLIEMEVLEPNLVRVQGVWVDGQRGFVVTDHAVHLVERGSNAPRISFSGKGKDTVMAIVGPVDQALFSFATAGLDRGS